MSEEKKVVAFEKKEDDLKVKLSQAYDFEGEKITEVDLTGLNDVTADDMIQANKVLTANGSIAAVPEITLEYALVMAGRVSGLPIEFFKTLKPRDAMKIKNRVTNFLYGED